MIIYGNYIRYGFSHISNKHAWPFVGKCRKLLDSCSVATHRGELFCKNCHARSFPTATSASSTSPLVPADFAISPEVTATSAPVPTEAAIEICDSILPDLDCRCCRTGSDAITLENSSPREKNRDSRESNRFRGGGVDEQRQAFAKPPWTAPSIESPASDNAVDISGTINETNRPVPRRPERREDRSKGQFRENLEQIESNPQGEQTRQRADSSQNVARPVKESDLNGGMSSPQNRLR